MSIDGIAERDQVTYENRNGVAWVTINRPEARNALNKAVRNGLFDAFARFNDDEDCAVMVLTGSGDKAFSAGGDLKEMATDQLQVPPIDFVPQPGRTITVDKPIIAAVNGVAFAGGFLLMQNCDLVIAVEDAKFGVTEVKRGRGAPWGVPIPWLIPPRIAMELLLTGDPISAQRAYEVGLINRVVKLNELFDAAQTLAETIAANAPLSVAAAKQMVLMTAEVGRSEAFEQAEEMYISVYTSEDAQEGPRAFAEKRPPIWRGV